ncbi:hypothetical protein D3C80_1372220 [compost metagenome]
MAFTLDLDDDKLGQGVYYGYTDSVQAPGYLIALTAKFSTGMQYGHNDFQGRFFQLRIFTDGDASPIIDNGNTVVLMNDNFNFVAISSQSLVNTVINDFPYEVMKTLAARGANIHPRTFTNGL